jgi:LPS sulfotransferase NodH
MTGDLDVHLPERSLLICGSQRSGTSLLCRALADTGVCGQPEEYFLAEDPAKLPDWRFWEEGFYGVRHGAKDRVDYLRIVYGLGASPNGVFAAKLMWNNLPWAVRKFQEMPSFAEMSRAAIFRAAFPGLRVVNVRRRDRVRQAVSWARMAQDGVWVVSDDEPAVPSRTPKYDFDLIAALERLILDGELGWRLFYEELGLTPYEVVYEDLVAPGVLTANVTGILEHVGVRAPSDVILHPRTHRQADSVNDEWTARYLAEKVSAEVNSRPE